MPRGQPARPKESIGRGHGNRADSQGRRQLTDRRQLLVAVERLGLLLNGIGDFRRRGTLDLV